MQNIAILRLRIFILQQNVSDTITNHINHIKMKKIKYNENFFKEWKDLNRFSYNEVVRPFGQRDPNKVGRWYQGQPIGTEDIIKLCNSYNLEVTDFFIEEECEEEYGGVKQATALPDYIKERREKERERMEQKQNTVQLPADTATLALEYERKINNLLMQHAEEIKGIHDNYRLQQRDSRSVIDTLQKNIEALSATIAAQQATIMSQQNTIATYDALVRKQKKIPLTSESLPFGTSTMVNEPGFGG